MPEVPDHSQNEADESQNGSNEDEQMKVSNPRGEVTSHTSERAQNNDRGKPRGP